MQACTLQLYVYKKARASWISYELAQYCVRVSEAEQAAARVVRRHAHQTFFWTKAVLVF